MNKDIKYDITYEHLKDELVSNSESEWHFNRVKDRANKYKLELSDDDFKRLFKLNTYDKDIDWIMYRMSEYKLSLVDVLVSYLAY